MTIDVEIDGKVHCVLLEKAAGLKPCATGGAELQFCVFRVTVDGVATDVEVTELKGGRMSLLVGEASGPARRSVEALVGEKGPAGDLTIVVANGTFDARVFGTRGVWGARRRIAAGEHAAGTNEISAPMPGRITRVLVAPGDTVQPRQPLIVVEAMKMENELRARSASRVKDVLVTEGALVEAGRVLVVLEH